VTITVQWFLFWRAAGSVPFEESALQKQKHVTMNISEFYSSNVIRMKSDSSVPSFSTSAAVCKI
jgi:hypothetical protein